MLWTTDYMGYRTHEDIDSVFVFGTSPSIFRQRGVTKVNLCSPVSECRNVKSLRHLPVEKAAAADHSGPPRPTSQPAQLAMKYYKFKLCGLGDESSVFVLVAFDSATFRYQDRTTELRTSYMKTLFFPALARLSYTSITSKFGGVAAAGSADLQASATAKVHESDWSMVCDYIDTLSSRWEGAVEARAVYYYVAAHGARFDVRKARLFLAEHCRLDWESVSKQVLVHLHLAVTVSPGTGRASFVYLENDSLVEVPEEGGEDDEKEEKEGEERDLTLRQKAAGLFGSSWRLTESRPYGLVNAGHVKGWEVRLPGSELAATVTDVQAYDPNLHIVKPLLRGPFGVRRVLVPYVLFGRYRDAASEGIASPESCGTRDGLAESRLDAAETLARWNLFVRSVADEVKLRVECVHTFANLNDPLLRKTLEWTWIQPVGYEQEEDDTEAYASALVGFGSGIETFVKTWARELVNALQVRGQLVTCVEGWESWVNSTAKTWIDTMSDEIDGHQGEREDDSAFAHMDTAIDEKGKESAIELRRQRRLLPKGFHLPFASCVRRVYDAETLLLRYAFSSRALGAGVYVDWVANRRAGMYTDDEEPVRAYCMSTHDDNRLITSRRVLVRRYNAFNDTNSGVPPMTDREIKKAMVTTALPWMEKLVVYLWRTLPAGAAGRKPRRASPSSCTEGRDTHSLRTQAERLLHVHAYRIASLTGKREPSAFYTVYSSHASSHSRKGPEEVRDVVDVDYVVRMLTDKKDVVFRLILAGTVVRPENRSFLECLRETVRRHVEVVPLFDEDNVNLRRWATVVDLVHGRVKIWNFAVDELRRELNFGRRALNVAAPILQGDPGVGWKAELIARLGTGEKLPYELAFVLALFVAQPTRRRREVDQDRDDLGGADLDYTAVFRYVTRHSLSIPKLRRLGLLVDGECYMGTAVRPDLVSWLTPTRDIRSGRDAEADLEEQGNGTRGPLVVASTSGASAAAATGTDDQTYGVSPSAAAMPPPRPPTLPMRSEGPIEKKRRKKST